MGDDQQKSHSGGSWAAEVNKQEIFVLHEIYFIQKHYLIDKKKCFFINCALNCIL
jgi:hypothetical protein